MKQDHAYVLIRAAIRGNVEEVRRLVGLQVAELRQKNRDQAARQLERLLGEVIPRQLIPLPEAPAGAAFDWERPQRRLSSIRLPADLSARVQTVIDENQAAEWLLENGLNPPVRLLLTGPTGVGKTSLARAMSTELALPLATIRLSTLVDSHIGGTSRALDVIFKAARQTPSVLFLDEIDSIASTRSSDLSAGQKENNRIVNTLLLLIDQTPATTLIIGATNFPGVLDGAVVRRFETRIPLPPPSDSELFEFARELLRHPPSVPVDLAQVQHGWKNYADVESDVLRLKRAEIMKQWKAAKEVA